MKIWDKPLQYFIIVLFTMGVITGVIYRAYEFVAIIAGPFAAILTVSLEYRKDKDEKLQDRKELWLLKHYSGLYNSIKAIINNISKVNDMIYNGTIKISINEVQNSEVPQMDIANNIEPLCEGGLGMHLSSYAFYKDLRELSLQVDNYIRDLKSSYDLIINYVQNTINIKLKYFRPVNYLLDDHEVYIIDKIFYAIMYSVLKNNEIKIYPSDTGEEITYFTVAYQHGSDFKGMFFSKSNKSCEIFMNDIMPELIEHFRDNLLELKEKSDEISAENIKIIAQLRDVLNKYDVGFSIKGECSNCKSIKDVEKLNELMPHS
jgi:hypothetical protein